MSQKTATGLFLPTSATSSPLPEATVIATGPGAPNRQGNIVPTSVKAGDKVLLPGWGGNVIKVGEEVCLSCYASRTRLLTTVRNTTSSKTRRFSPRSRSRRLSWGFRGQAKVFCRDSIYLNVNNRHFPHSLLPRTVGLFTPNHMPKLTCIII